MTTGTSSETPAGDPPEFRIVAQQIGRVTSEVANAGWQEAVNRYGALEPPLVALFGSEADRTEVRRRICEAMVAHVSVANPAPQPGDYESVWQRMEQAGFTNSERQLSMLFWRLSYLIKNKPDDPAVSDGLARFHEVVQALRQQGEGALAEHFSAVYERLRSRHSRN